MQIRNYQDTDYFEIANIFYNSIHAIPTSIYSKEELESWSPSPPDYNHWKERLAVKKPFVAVKNKIIVGFIEIETDGHIDCPYVHKDHQGKGIASDLLQHIRIIANKTGINKLHVEASKIAMPFFHKHGFELQSSNSVNLRGQSLKNYCMSSSTTL